MERLTYRHDDGSAAFVEFTDENGNTEPMARCMWRFEEALAAYEDMGLTPEEFHESVDYILALNKKLKPYFDAEEAGLLLRLPCRIGATVYRVVEKCEGGADCPFEGGYGISRCRASNDYYAFCDAHVEKTKFELAMLDDIGKTVFLTYTEANSALVRRTK